MAVTLKPILNHRPKADGTHHLLLQVTVNRRHRAPGLNIYILKTDYNKKVNHKLDPPNYIKSSNTDHEELNKYLKQLISAVQQRVRECQLAGVAITLDSVVGIVKGILNPVEDNVNQQPDVSLTNFYLEYISRYQVNSPALYTTFNDALKRFTDYNQGELFFKQVTPDFIIGFINWATTIYKHKRTKRSLGPSTINLYFEKLKAVIKQAKLNQLVEDNYNPFLGHKPLKIVAKEPDIITPEELEKIESIELTFDSALWHARNIILCQYYTLGSRTSDMQKLKFSEINDLKMEFRMQKTKQLQRLKMHAKLFNLLELYEYRRENNIYVFPYRVNNADYDDLTFARDERLRIAREVVYYMKKLFKMLAINKRAGTHLMRHSFSGNVLLSGQGLYGLSKALGHSNSKTTEIYTRSVERQVVEKLADDFYKEN